jgi:leucyl aminopeptidase (aminopeptidase T)
MTYELIHKIVVASGVTSGESVLIHFWGDDKDKEIANKFMIAVASVGATPTLLQQSREINKRLFSVVKDESFGEDYFEKLSSFDAVLDLFSYQPIILGYEIEPRQFALYRKYIATLFSALMKSKRFTQIRIPTADNAEESCLDPVDYIHRMYKAYDIDYENLNKQCKSQVDKYEGLEAITIETSEKCKITFVTKDRAWHIDAGDGDMPCGEIYIAPVEDKTNGTIFFRDIYLDVKLYNDVIITVCDGKILSADNESVSAYFSNLKDNERTVCELGIGMNPNVNDICGYTVLDEKMQGTFHIAIGSNTMFGGKNTANIHEDFVCTSEYKIISP